jgi:dihydroorotate dehydrogenase
MVFLFPSFAIPKKKGTIRLVNNFRNLNLLLKRRMSPMSYSKNRAADMIRSMEGFTFASALDLNMGYHHIKFDADAQKLCTIVFLWQMEEFKYKRLPMGIKIAPDIFQNVMSKLVQDMEFVKTNILS